MRAHVVIVAFLLGSVLAPANAAQEATPATSFTRPSNVTEMLFEANELGDGWILVDPVVTDILNTATWEQAATAVYSGPNGDRVSVAIRYVLPNRDAIVNVEDVLDNLFYQYEYYELNDADERSIVLTGCDDARGIEGSNGWWRDTGLVSCLIGLDVVLWVETQGVVLEANGIDAASNVVALILQ